MWGIIFGTFFILTGCAGLFISGIVELAGGALALGVVLFIWGAIRLMQGREIEDELPEEQEAAPDFQQPTAEQAAPAEAVPAEAAPADAPAAAAAPPAAAEGSAPQPEPAPADGVQIANAPQEPPSLFKRGLRYLFSMDRPSGLKKAASCFIEGYEKGDLNAGYMLCHCYSEGLGVPVKPAFVVQLAEYLVKRHYYPAYWQLAAAYREGRGVPMNMALSAEYAKKFLDMCSAPIEGIDELMRYDALIHHELHQDEPDLRVLEQLARGNFAISKLPSRYSILALALLRDARCSGSAREELHHLLDEGCQADDMGSYYLRGMLQLKGCPPYFPRDKKRGMEYLRLAAERLGTPATLLAFLHSTEDEAQELLTLERFWSACRWGVSGVKGSDELHCHISLHSPELLPARHAGEPLIYLKNQGETTLHSAVLRVCSIDKKLDVSVKLAPLAAGESVHITPAEHGLELGKRLYVEVHKEGLTSRLYLHRLNALRDIGALAD